MLNNILKYVRSPFMSYFNITYLNQLGITSNLLKLTNSKESEGILPRILSCH